MPVALLPAIVYFILLCNRMNDLYHFLQIKSIFRIFIEKKQKNLMKIIALKKKM